MALKHLVISVLILALSAGAALADLYIWTDSNGVKRYSDSPPPSGTANVKTTEEIQYDEAADRQRTARDAQEVERIHQQSAEQSAAAAEAKAKADAEREKKEAELKAEEARREAYRKANRGREARQRPDGSYDKRKRASGNLEEDR